MSVFSKLKRSRQAAKEHKSKNAEKDGDGNDVAAKVSYRHVPTHAAIDALNGTPASWKASDRPKILEQHKRRSQMNISRTPSTLSTMSIAEARTSVAPPLPRNSSYSSYNPAWFDRPGGESSSMGANMYYPNESSSKRHKPARGLSYHEPSIGRSPLSNSPVESEGISHPDNTSKFTKLIHFYRCFARNQLWKLHILPVLRKSRNRRPFQL